MLRSKDEVKMTYNQDGSFDMHFISSDIHIDRNHTARVIAPSCGDGKTTMIKYIMKHYFQYGILVAVDTIDEVKMYGEYIKNELIGYTSVNGFTLTEDDYILLHSNNENKQFEYTYASNPLDIMNKAIVVCTHHKFFNNDPRLFIHMNVNVRNPEVLKGINLSSLSIFKQAVGCGPLAQGLKQVGADGIRRRQFILIDEMPKCNVLKRRLGKPELSCLVHEEVIDNPKTKFHIGIIRYDANYMPIYGKVVDEWHDPIIKFSLDDKNELYFNYRRTFLNSPKDDPTRNNTRVIDDLNTMAILDSLYDGFDFYTRGCARNNDGQITSYGVTTQGTLRELPEYIDVVYNLSTLADPNMQTNLWLFDGTGDLTFCGANNFYMSLPDLHKPKFQSPINFYKIDISSGRRFKESTLFGKFDKVKDILDNNINILLSIFKKNPNNKFLIDSWKNLKFNGAEEKQIKSYHVGIEKYLSKEGKNILFNLTDYYSDYLTPIINQMKSTGELGPDFEFSFIHYQSGLDRATNQFRDYDSIVFLGEFIIPQSAIDEHNTNMGAKTDLIKYTVHQLVQAACRLRVRKHTGEPINIYYTSDWNEGLMILLGLYLSDKPLSQRMDFLMKSGSEMMEPNYLSHIQSILTNFTDRSLNNLKPKWRKVIRVLMDYDSNLEYAIVSKNPYIMNIHIDKLFELIPMSEKKERAYYPLMNQLKTLGIDLRIDTNWMNEMIELRNKLNGIQA